MHKTINNNGTSSDSTNFTLISYGDLNTLINEIKELRREVVELKSSVNPSVQIYTTKQVQEILHVNEKLIKKYRDNGLLGFSRMGDKYWYTQDDINKFINSCHVEPYNVVD